MAISFNNIPANLRTPGAYGEIDNSRALKGLVANPHKVLLLGQKISTGTKATDTLIAITRDGLADGFFGPGSNLARMCNRFKSINPNTELYALALSNAAAGVAASCDIHFTGSATADGTVYLLVGGDKVYTPVTSGWSGGDIASAVKSDINAVANSGLCAHASATASTARIVLIANNTGAFANQYDARVNYYEGQSNPTGVTISITAFAGGANNPDIGDAWTVVEGEQFEHIALPYTDAANMTELKDELETRFGPLVDKQGFGYTAYRGTAASCTTHGNSQNSPHYACMGYYDGPNTPEDWAVAICAAASGVLESDPARPVQFITLKGILPPPYTSRFTQAERNVLLFDGVSTFIVDDGGSVMIERIVTTYQSNALGLPDSSYLNIETMFTLMEIRYQWRARMVNRFIGPRYKLADDTFPVQAGSFVVTPKTIKQETIALFATLQERGLIENLADFVTNLKVERDATDTDRINILLPPDLINQFRVVAGLFQFIL